MTRIRRMLAPRGSRSAAIQYTALTNPPSPLDINLYALIQLVRSAKERYLSPDTTVLVMHRLTATALRQDTASTSGDYYWQPSLQAGQGPLLLDYPVFTCDAMATVVVAMM